MREQSTTNNIFQPKHVRGGETKVMKAMKKSILTFLAFALVFTMAMPAFAANVATGATYSDVENADVADAVKVLSSLDVLKGYPDGTFKPDNTITRAEFAAVVVRLLGFEKAAQAAVGKTQFKDEVLPWASGYVNIAVQQNLLTGYPDGTFRANQPVTQAEAITILVRALGYKALADKQGQWPYNYIVMANTIGLTDALDGVAANQAASRGYVALASKAALDAPMAIAKSFNFNGEPIYTMSGTDGTDKVTILEKYLGYDRVKEVVVDIPRLGMKDGKIKLAKTGTVNVPADFDYEAAFGTELTAYLDGKDVVYAKAGAVKLDAIKEKDGKIELVNEKAKYTVDKDAVIYINGAEKAFKDIKAGQKISYAKVAFNKEGDIRFIDAFDLDNSMVFDEVVKDTILSGYGYELNVKDYALVKEGKTVKPADLEKGDIVFFNKSAEYAEVFNKSIEGELDKVYVNSFKIDGKTYDVTAKAQYVNDEEKLVSLVNNSEDLEGMKKQGAVNVFFNRLGDVVFVAGDLGIAPTSTFYGLVVEDTYKFTEKAQSKWTLVVMNPAGEVKEYAVSNSYATTNGKDDFKGELGWENDIKVGEIVKVKLDDKGTLKSVALPDAEVQKLDGFKVDSKFADHLRLTDSAVVYWTQDAPTTDLKVDTAGLKKYKDTSKIKVMTWGKVADEFSKINNGYFYADDKADVRAVNVVATNVNVDNIKKLAVVTDVYKYSGKDKWELTVEIDGEEFTYITADGVKVDTTVVKEGTVVNLEIGDKSGLIEADLTSVKPADVTGNAPKATIVDNKITITKADGTKKDYTLVAGATIYNEDLDHVELADVEDYKYADIYLAASGSIFAKYVFVSDDKTPDPVATGLVTSISSTEGSEAIVVDNKTIYFINAKTVLTDKDGNVKAIGTTAVIAGLTVDGGDQVEVKATDSVATEIKIVKTKAELDKAKALTEANAELAKVKSAYVIPFADPDYANETAKATAAAIEVAKDVDGTKVTVGVAFANSKYTVTLTSKAVSEVKVEKEITLTVAAASTDASVKSVTVKGLAATVDAADNKVYNVTLPVGTVLAELLPSDVVVKATDANATVGTVTTSDGGATWTFDITAQDTTTKVPYTVKVVVAQ